MDSSISTEDIDGDTLHLDLWYPTVGDNVKFIEINLMSVRASDGIRVSYDFNRDGWKIEQPAKLEWEEDDEVCDMEWTEVSFVQSWQLEEESDDVSTR